MQIDLPLEAIQARLAKLVAQGLLLEKAGGVFVVPDLARIPERP